jgi:hypothetical protein
MAIPVSGGAQSVSLGGGYVLRAPGLRGTADVRPPGAAGVRSARADGDGLDALDSALRAENVAEVKVIDLDLRPEPGARAADAMRGAQGEPQLELEVPDLGPEVGQVVMSVDDAGAVRWHFAVSSAAGTAARGAGATKRFRIPATIVPPPPDAATARERSVLGAAARRVLKVLVYPITDPVVGFIADKLAARFEASKRPYRLRSFTPENHGRADVPSLTDEEVAKVCAGGPVLLFIHGTFSTTHGGFGDLPDETVRKLHAQYGGRVMAFDHPTLSAGPDDNVRWLLQHLPKTPVQIDIVCHSRGGLVSRVLTESHASAGLDAAHVTVRRVIFAGTPNQGTALADPDHMVDMLDRFTTALTLAPTGPVTETLEAVVTVVKMIGHGGLKGLEGLAAMHASGPFLAGLNQRDGRRSEYFAIASNYQPTDRGLQALVMGAADKVVDKIFGDSANDLVVPTEGVWKENGGGGFPLQDTRVFTFPPAKGVMHTTYFRQPEVSEKLVAWLA